MERPRETTMAISSIFKRDRGVIRLEIGRSRTSTEFSVS